MRRTRGIVVVLVVALSVFLLSAGAVAEKTGKEKAATPAGKAAAKAGG